MKLEQEKMLIELAKNDCTYQELLTECGMLKKISADTCYTR